jgi:hypothetical protein
MKGAFQESPDVSVHSAEHGEAASAEWWALRSLLSLPLSLHKIKISILLETKVVQKINFNKFYLLLC